MRSIWFSVDTLQCKSVTKSFCKLFSSLHTFSKCLCIATPVPTITSHKSWGRFCAPLRTTTYYAMQPFPPAPLLKLLRQNPLYCSFLTCHTSWGPLCAPLRTTIYYALLPFRVAPFSCCALLKLLKQTPRYCSLLKPSVGDWNLVLGVVRQKFSGGKSYFLKYYLRCAYGPCSPAALMYVRFI